MKQIKRLKEKIERQLSRIKGERRKNRRKRDFIESIFTGQQATKDREIAMQIITYTIIRMRELHNDCGVDEMVNVLFKDEP